MHLPPPPNTSSLLYKTQHHHPNSSLSIINKPQFHTSTSLSLSTTSCHLISYHMLSLSPSRISSPSTFLPRQQQDRVLMGTGGEGGAFAADLGLPDMEIMHGFNMSNNNIIISSSNNNNNSMSSEEDMVDLRRGPWTVEEDLILVNYINANGEGRWNSLARSAGLKRTGKSCRLRWLNYLRPDVRRGNITPEEQLLILELHSRWGNRWSKIAQHLPGRTDNEIKNYWRTRVQKHAKQLRCDVNSKQFKDVMRHVWIPRLVERIRHANSVSASADVAVAEGLHAVKTSPENSSSFGGCSSDSLVTQQLSPLPASEFTGGGAVCFSAGEVAGGDVSWCGDFQAATTATTELGVCQPDSMPSPCGYFGQGLPEMDQSMWGAAVMPETIWSLDDDFWSLQQLQQQQLLF